MIEPLSINKLIKDSEALLNYERVVRQNSIENPDTH